MVQARHLNGSLMPRATFRLEESIGLALAVALHVGVGLLLVLHPSDRVVPTPPRMEVSLSDNVGLKESAPRQSENAAADIAPKLGMAPPPPAPPPPPKPVPKPQPAPKPLPVPPPPPPKPAPPKPTPRPSPRPTKAPPVSKPVVKPVPKPSPPPKALAPAPTPAKAHPAPAKAAAAPQDATRKPAKTAGGSRIGADFLKGVTSANTTGKAKAAPSQTAGPAVQAAIAGVISRQLKEHWTAPQGVDADRLVTILAFDLNRDGTLDGPPRVVRQEGVTDSNRPQAARHAEQAIRAVELAEPFQLPPEYYDTWKRITSSRFDRKMSQ